MRADTIYLKLEQNSQVSEPRILLKDVAEIYMANQDRKKEAEQLVLYTLQDKKKQQVLVFSANKVIALLQKQWPEVSIENIGEADFVVEYHERKRPAKWVEYLKAVLISMIVFFGAGFTIMTFNTDVSVGEVFSLFYKLVMGTKQTQGSIMEITYCVGIAIGILGFYNHFSSHREREDPTPLHLEMRSYEEERNRAIIKNASREGKEIS